MGIIRNFSILCVGPNLFAKIGVSADNLKIS
jgi:hypothetical protein